ASIIVSSNSSAAPTSSSGSPPPSWVRSSTAAATINAVDANASGGRSLIQGLDLIIVSSFPRGRFPGVQKLLVVQQLGKAETRPNFRTLHESPVEIVIATNHRCGNLILPVVVREPANAEHLVDDERRRHVAARR